MKYLGCGLLAACLLACGGDGDSGQGGAASNVAAPTPGTANPGVAGTGGGTVAPTGPTAGTSPTDPVTDGPGETPVVEAPGMGGEPPVTDPPTEPGVEPPVASSGCGAADWPADGAGTFDIEGTTREYIVTLPDGYDPNVQHKLIFAWHGLGGTDDQIASGYFPGREYMGIRALSGGTTIFATGQGLEAAGGGAGWSSENDFPFVQTLIDHIKGNYCVDEARMFSTGASYGGIQSNRLGCRFGEQFRAIAPIMGSGPTSFFGGANCAGQVAAWITHGRMDSVVMFSSGEGSRDYWVGANHCGATTTAIGPEECVAYDGCDADYPVVWCPTDLGHTPPSFSAQEIWSFFDQF